MLYKRGMKIELWQAIRKARKDAGLSQEEVGAACSPPVSKAAVGLWESPNEEKRTKPKYDNLKTFCELTGVSMSSLLSGGGPKKAQPSESPDDLSEFVELYSRASTAGKRLAMLALTVDIALGKASPPGPVGIDSEGIIDAIRKNYRGDTAPPSPDQS